MCALMRCSLHEQITKERDVNNFLKKHRAWLSKLKQSKTRQREESEEVPAVGFSCCLDESLFYRLL